MNTQTPATDSPVQDVRARKQITDISSMLLAIEGCLLLLPGVAVAEIVNYVPPEVDNDEETPAWYLGAIYWRNQRVPLVSFEAMTGRRAPLTTSHCRIAVMNNTGLSNQLKFFAILLRTTPKLLRLTPDEIAINNEKILEEGEKLHVVVVGEEAVIPDIQYVEQKIIDLLELG
jgi:chemosensory pili system protein ChpC